MTELTVELPALEETPDELNTQQEELNFYASRKLIVDWNDEDQAAIDQIRSFAQETYLGIFSASLEMMEELYEKTQQGDNLGLLTLKELEGYLFKLASEKIEITLKLDSAMLDAIFAKYSLDDDYHAAYLEGSGTNNLREAKAHTETIEKRYGYFFRFYVWTMCKGLSKEIDGVMGNLKSALYRRSNNA